MASQPNPFSPLPDSKPHRRNHPWRIFRSFGLSSLVVLVVLFIWPTRYRYDKMVLGERTLPVRIDRLSGNAEMLMTDGWRSMKRAMPSSPLQDELSSLELSRLTGTARAEASGWIEANLYNGNAFAVRSVVLTVFVKAADGEVVLSRDYQLSTTDGGPLQSSEFIANLGFKLESGQKLEWRIKSAQRR